MVLYSGGLGILIFTVLCFKGLKRALYGFSAFGVRVPDFGLTRFKGFGLGACDV